MIGPNSSDISCPMHTSKISVNLIYPGDTGPLANYQDVSRLLPQSMTSNNLVWMYSVVLFCLQSAVWHRRELKRGLYDAPSSAMSDASARVCRTRSLSRLVHREEGPQGNAQWAWQSGAGAQSHFDCSSSGDYSHLLQSNKNCIYCRCILLFYRLAIT
jgi:hypothetical protein